MTLGHPQIACGNMKLCSHSEKQMAGCKIFKYITRGPRDSTLGYVHRKNKNC